MDLDFIFKTFITSLFAVSKELPPKVYTNLGGDLNKRFSNRSMIKLALYRLGLSNSDVLSKIRIEGRFINLRQYFWALGRQYE